MSSTELSGYRLERAQEAHERRVMLLVSVAALAAMLSTTIVNILH